MIQINATHYILHDYLIFYATSELRDDDDGLARVCASVHGLESLRSLLQAVELVLAARDLARENEGLDGLVELGQRRGRLAEPYEEAVDGDALLEHELEVLRRE